MTEGLIDTEWSRLAKDDGTITLQHFDYAVVVGGDTAEEITSTPTSLNYSPSVNKAKDITIDVSPLEVLEGLTYLGEPVQLYVDEQLAFDGEIKEIETQQKEGEDYSIIGKPFGKKLHGSDIQKTVNNEIVSDTVSLLVNRYNDYHNEHELMAGTADETLVDVVGVGGNVREATASSGTATYSNVGSDLSALTSVYVKAYVPSSEDLRVRAISNSATDKEFASGLEKNSYGEWVRFTDFSDVSESYDLEFRIKQDTSFVNWIAVTDEVVKTDTTSPDVSVISTGNNFYSWADSELETNANTTGNGIVYDSNGHPRNRQITAWGTDPFPVYGDEQFVGGEGGRVEVGTSTSEWDFTSSESLDNWDIYARVKPYEIFVNRNEDHTTGNTPYDDDWSTNASASNTQAAVNSTSVEVTGDAWKYFQWDFNRNDQVGKIWLEGQAYLPGAASPAWVIEQGGDGYGLQITSSGDFRLVRRDGGSQTTLDTDTSYTQQTGEWFDFSITIDENTDVVEVTLSDSGGTYSLSTTDTTHTVFDRFKVYTSDTHYLDDMLVETGGSIKNINITTSINTDSLSYGLTIGANYRDVEWLRIASHDFTSSWPDSLSGTTDIHFTADSDSETGFGISPVVGVHEKSNWSESDFDLTLDEADGHLDYPPIYSNGDVFDNTVIFNEKVSDENIFESTVEGSIANTTSVSANWGFSQVIDTSATSFPSPSNSTSTTDSYPYPGVQHVVKTTLSSSGFRDTASPREGYQRQRLDDFSVTTSTSDLEVLYDQDISDNRLSVMNSLAEESSVLFRWEGDTAKIFHRGQETTNLNLRSENIKSSVSIEDVYRYCEVIGLHNERSGVIESSNAPSYIDDEKVIRDDTIENESDAKSRAKQFLAEHGSVKFKGQIRTKPTFAPLGAEMNGSLFNHGQDMIINGVRYGKRKTTVTLGYNKNIATELISLEKQSSDSKGRTTGRGMKIPVGNEQI